MAYIKPGWETVKEAVKNCDRKAAYAEIKEFIKHKYGDLNDSTITCQIIVCTVNHATRIHYHENKKPRLANSKYDFLFATGRGQVEWYRPDKHGLWGIRKDDEGGLTVQRVDDQNEAPSPEVEIAVKVEDTPVANQESDLTFPLESHLRDFIARNLPNM